MICLCFLLVYFLFLKMLTVSVYLNHWAKVDYKLNHTLLTLKIHEWFFIVFKKIWLHQPHLWTLVWPLPLPSSFSLGPLPVPALEIPRHTCCSVSSLQYCNKAGEITALKAGNKRGGFCSSAVSILKQIDNSVFIGLSLKGSFFFFKQGSITTDWSFPSFTADFVKEIHLECF